MQNRVAYSHPVPDAGRNCLLARFDHHKTPKRLDTLDAGRIAQTQNLVVGGCRPSCFSSEQELEQPRQHLFE
jgi:hypothetical protein